MSTLTENILIQSIKIIPATGVIEVERVTQVLRDGEVIATSPPAVQTLEPHADLTSIEPAVAAVAAAAWTPDQVAAATAAMLTHMQERQAEQDRRMADLNRSMAAVTAANVELDAEHATLADRSAKITSDRASLFAQSEALRTGAAAPTA